MKMTEIICPHCRKPIYDDDALLCHFCGESLHRAGKGLLGRIKYSYGRIIWFFVIGCLLFLFVLWIAF